MPKRSKNGKSSITEFDFDAQRSLHGDLKVRALSRTPWLVSLQVATKSNLANLAIALSTRLLKVPKPCSCSALANALTRLPTEPPSCESLNLTSQMSEIFVSEPWGICHTEGPHYGTNRTKPIVLVELSTAKTDIYLFFTLPKTLTKRHKGRI